MSQRRKHAREEESPEKARSAARDYSMVLTLLRGYYWFEDSVSNYVRSKGWPDFTRAESMLMSNIILGHRRPSDIARQLGISRQAVHVTVRQLEKKGIVETNDDPENRRIKQVLLTRIGKKMRDDGLVAMEIVLAALADRVGQGNLACTARTLSADWGPPLKFGADRSESSRRSSTKRRNASGR